MFDLARDFAALLRESGDFEPVVEPESNIVCFRYLKRGEGDLDGLQRRVRRALLESGRFYIVQTNLRGHVWLRSTLINPRTTFADLEALLDEIREAASNGMH
jgi:L-2,4-diaminobutyrate decarboxylase